MEVIHEPQRDEAYNLCETCTALLSAVPGIVFHLVGRKGAFAFSFISGAAMELCGFTPQSLVEDASQLWMRVQSEDRQNLFEVILRNSKDIRLVEFRYWHPERGLLWLEGRFATSSLREGDNISVQGVITDVGTRKELEKLFRERDTEYLWLFSQMRQPVSVHDIVQDEHGRVVDFVFVDGNHALEALLKRSVDDLRGKSIREVNPSVPPEMIEALGKVALTGEPLAQDYYSHGTGRSFHVVSYSPRRGRFVSIHTDMTDWRRAEDALRDTNRVLKALNDFSVAQANCLVLNEFTKLAADQLYDYIKPVAVGFALYDSAERVLRLDALRAEPDDISRVVSNVGPGFLQVKLPVDDATYARLSIQRVEGRETLTEATAGVISPGVAAAIQAAVGIGYFIVVPLAADGVLYGSLLLALNQNAPMPSCAWLEQFAYLTSISLRRLQAEERVRHISLHDQLTGLYNRHYFELTFENAGNQETLPLAVIMADLNGLKAVNDILGHARGDEILVSVSDVIRGVCKPNDKAIRWGGDEFLVVLPRTDYVGAEKVAREIAAGCLPLADAPLSVTVALGVACKTQQTQELRTVIREAEDAMYKNKLANVSSARSGVLITLLKLLEEKSFETQAHSKRMQEVALAIAKAIKLPSPEVERLKLAILLHDIGKINMPEDLLVRKGPLHAEEWRLMKRHPEIGSRIALSTPDFAHVADEILSHHERWDGEGYPRGLKGDEIPLLARIVSIVDAYEVMSYGRPYKAAMPNEAIVAEFKRCAGTHFDPKLVAVFLDHLGRGPGGMGAKPWLGSGFTA